MNIKYDHEAITIASEIITTGFQGIVTDNREKQFEALRDYVENTQRTPEEQDALDKLLEAAEYAV